MITLNVNGLSALIIKLEEKQAPTICFWKIILKLKTHIEIKGWNKKRPNGNKKKAKVTV